MPEQPRDRVDPILDFIRDADPARDLAAKAVAIRLRRCAHAVDTAVRRRLSPQGMEFWELELLTNLVRHDGEMTIGRLQDAAQLTSGAMTNRITRLEDNGFVERLIDPHDRRHVRVAITAAGRARSAALIEANDAVERDLFGTLDRELLLRIGDDLRDLLLALEGPATD